MYTREEEEEEVGRNTETDVDYLNESINNITQNKFFWDLLFSKWPHIYGDY